MANEDQKIDFEPLEIQTLESTEWDDDPVRNFLEERRYTSCVVKGGIDLFIPAWEEFVSSYILEYNDEYDNDLEDWIQEMDGRQLIYDILSVMPPSSLKEEYERRINKADIKLREKTLYINKCINEENEKYDHDIHWWFFIRPLKVNSEFLLAVNI